jgi:hypothetical protein
MASVTSIDNNTKGFKGQSFDSFNYDGENFSDTRNTRKQVNGKKDPQKAKWESRRDYYGGWKPGAKVNPKDNPKVKASDSSDDSDDSEDDDDDDDSNDNSAYKPGFNPTDGDKKTFTRQFRQLCVSQDKKVIAKGARKRDAKNFTAACS